jgi:hypothetical protein
MGYNWDKLKRRMDQYKQRFVSGGVVQEDESNSMDITQKKDEQEDTTSSPQTGGIQVAGQIQGQVGGQSAAPRSPTTRGSGQFTNLQKYVKANKPLLPKAGEKLKGKISETGSTIGEAIQAKKQEYAAPIQQRTQEAQTTYQKGLAAIAQARPGMTSEFKNIYDPQTQSEALTAEQFQAAKQGYRPEAFGQGIKADQQFTGGLELRPNQYSFQDAAFAEQAKLKQASEWAKDPRRISDLAGLFRKQDAYYRPGMERLSSYLFQKSGALPEVQERARAVQAAVGEEGTDELQRQAGLDESLISVGEARSGILSEADKLKAAQEQFTAEDKGLSAILAAERQAERDLIEQATQERIGSRQEYLNKILGAQDTGDFSQLSDDALKNMGLTPEQVAVLRGQSVGETYNQQVRSLTPEQLAADIANRYKFVGLDNLGQYLQAPELAEGILDDRTISNIEARSALAQQQELQNLQNLAALAGEDVSYLQQGLVGAGLGSEAASFNMAEAQRASEKALLDAANKAYDPLNRKQEVQDVATEQFEQLWNQHETGNITPEIAQSYDDGIAQIGPEFVGRFDEIMAGTKEIDQAISQGADFPRGPNAELAKNFWKKAKDMSDGYLAPSNFGHWVIGQYANKKAEQEVTNRINNLRRNTILGYLGIGDPVSTGQIQVKANGGVVSPFGKLKGILR